MSEFIDLQNEIAILKEDACLVAFKTGTEIEDMDFSEISILQSICRPHLPLYVKIGGCEARNDIRNLVEIGVDGLIAPMIESPFALEKFMESIKDLVSSEQEKKIKLGINIETLTGLNQLDAILTHPLSQKLDQVTAARSDLSASMKLEVEHPDVTRACALISARAQDHDIQTSIGGKIDPFNIQDIIKIVSPNTINSRHAVMDVKGWVNLSSDECSKMIIKNLQFENKLYEYLVKKFPKKASTYKRRIASLNSRIYSKIV